MKIIYTGPSPLAYHSSPTGFNYLFDPGVQQEVQKGDEQFFKNMTKAENSDFHLGGWKTKIEPKIEPKIKSKKTNGGKS